MLMTLGLLQFQNGATILRKTARGVNQKEICKPFLSLWRTSATLHHLAWVEQEEAPSHLTCEEMEAGPILTDSVGCSKPF